MITPKLHHILFLDIETAPLVYHYEQLAPELKELWDKKWSYLRDSDPTQLYAKAGIYAEFARVICIGVGFFNDGKFRVKVIHHTDEKALLNEFAELVREHFNDKTHFFCAHNGKEFDYPFLCRRMIVHGLELPRNLDLQGMKPWEVKHLDTMELWRFGDLKNFTSLNLLAHILNIPTPKENMDGSQVARFYYELQDLNSIFDYCMKDVVTVARVYQRFRGLPALSEEDIIFA